MKKLTLQEKAKQIKIFADLGHTYSMITGRLRINRAQLAHALDTSFPSNSGYIKEKIRQNRTPANKDFTTSKEKITSSWPHKKKGIVIDASIVNIYTITDILYEFENNFFIFNTLTIEKLEEIADFSEFGGNNAEILLEMTMRENGIILPTQHEEYSGEYISDNENTHIISSALCLKEKLDLEFFTCNEKLASKIKKFNMKSKYFEPYYNN